MNEQQLRQKVADTINEQASASLPDETALEGVELFPAWGAGADYEISVRVRYAGKLYRCEQSHTAQDGWEPPVTPALWTINKLSN